MIEHERLLLDIDAYIQAIVCTKIIRRHMATRSTPARRRSCPSACESLSFHLDCALVVPLYGTTVEQLEHNQSFISGVHLTASSDQLTLDFSHLSLPMCGNVQFAGNLQNGSWSLCVNMIIERQDRLQARPMPLGQCLNWC